MFEQSAANTSSVINRATVTASSPGNTNDVTDTSDDPNTAEADDATIVNILQPTVKYLRPLPL